MRKNAFILAVILGVVVPCFAATIAAITTTQGFANKQATPNELAQYFVVTNEYYAEQYNDSLANMAANLHYYDLDAMIWDRYHQYGEITCTPLEAPSGTIVYDYGFKTSVWQVELCTMIEDETDTIKTWIILYNPADEQYAIESVPDTVSYRINNIIANLHQGAGSSTRLFECERKTFANLLSLVAAGALDVKDGLVPFDKVGLDYQIIEQPR